MLRVGMRTCLPCHIPDRWSRGANRIWPELAFGFVHTRSGNEIIRGWGRGSEGLGEGRILFPQEKVNCWRASPSEAAAYSLLEVRS